MSNGLQHTTFPKFAKITTQNRIFPPLRPFFSSLKVLHTKMVDTSSVYIVFWTILAFKLNFQPQNPNRCSPALCELARPLMNDFSMNWHVGTGNYETKEIQFMPELWRFEREKGGWEPQKTIVRKESEELPPTRFSLKPPKFRHKLNYFSPLLNFAL